ncbi:MAG: winged helix-turn-helix transcriptional regulator [Deltaproteobacteria bacterium]|nr:winged helix-turn-helix transcriptional regulator [Candidatus Anaeroferrophillus wilburensis]MBN2887766.1 winged helix-turn-helix transcriptional regulator [Deltaproteobacteria bacterium]
MNQAGIKAETVIGIDVFQLHASFCTIFSSPIRLQIMDLLGDGEKTVTQLAAGLDISLANVSQHLRLMRDQGAVATRRDGRTIYYRIANQKFLLGIQAVREGLLEELKKRGSLR